MACTWKNRVLLAAFWDTGKILILHLGQTEHRLALGDSPLCAPISLLLASFDVALPSEGKKPSWIDWTIEISPSTRWFLLCWFPARRSRFRVSRRATYCARRSLTLYRPVVHTCSHFGARVRSRDMPRGTARAPLHVLNILTVLEPMGPSSRRWLILLASHRMALSRERTNPSRIAREIEIFSIFDWSVPKLVPKHNSRFWVFRRTVCW